MAPHKSRYWIYPRIDDIEEFIVRVKKICDAYKHIEKKENPLEILQYHCSDEKTGIQALERKVVAMKLGRVEKREPEYIRNGTLCLIASRCVNTGKIDAFTVGDSRKEEDYLEHVKAIEATNLQAKHVIICDQLNTHKSASLVEWIASLENNKDNLGIKGKSGILESMVTRMKFLENKDHKVSFLYTPKHCSWLNQIEHWFGLLERKVLKRGNFISKEDLKSKIIAFIEYYNEYYAKPYVWKKSADKILKGFTS